MSATTTLETIYCDDEDIAIKAGGDFMLLAPRWQRLAYGIDGAFAAQSFAMTSQTATFTDDVADGNVIWLTKPADYYRGGEIFAISSVDDDNTITLRRLGTPDGVGLPPGGLAARAGVEFSVPTMMPQIIEATLELSRRLGIDANTIGRTPQDVRDLHDLQLATVLMVLVAQTAVMFQSDSKGGWSLKNQNHSAELESVLSRLRVRWGPSGSDDAETSAVTMRIGR